MPVTSRRETFAVGTSTEVVRVRHVVRAWAVDIGLSLIEQTKVVTAASELARNMVDYAKGGVLLLEEVDDGLRRGLRLTFEDKGPGIPNINEALRDGFTTGRGMGLGLGGAKRLANEFHIDSAPGEGTRVTIVRWKGAS